MAAREREVKEPEEGRANGGREAEGSKIAERGLACSHCPAAPRQRSPHRNAAISTHAETKINHHITLGALFSHRRLLCRHCIRRSCSRNGQSNSRGRCSGCCRRCVEDLLANIVEKAVGFAMTPLVRLWILRWKWHSQIVHVVDIAVENAEHLLIMSWRLPFSDGD